MTRKEAIIDLNALKFILNNDQYTDEIEEALDTAISALQQPEIVRCKECKHHWIHRCMDSMPTEICDLGQTFYDPNADFCSLAERRTDEKNT